MVQIGVDKWSIEQFKNARDDGTLNVNPEYQRRSVWKEKDKILLVDSIARRLPIGAITLYRELSEDGVWQYEVLDGKQRLTAIFGYLDGEFTIKRSVITQALDEDEDELPFQGTAAELYDLSWSSLTSTQRKRILQYEVPTFLVEGQRADAVFAFYRMNRTNYALKPQEIRNAVFNRTNFLDTVIGLEKRLTGDFSDSQHFFEAIGVVSRPGIDRMQDLQLISELLVLVMKGPQHRRDTLDEMYQSYRNAGEKELSAAADLLYKIVEQWYEIFDMQPLQAWHFPSNCEHDFYALVGALKEHGLLTKSQVDVLRSEIVLNISEFRKAVFEFVRAVRNREIEPDEFPQYVEDYGRTFLGGQINGKDKREARIRIIKNILDEVVQPLDKQRNFTAIQRYTIWARSADKKCARCGEVVAWKEFHAGHKTPWALGGRTVVENGQVEHANCNQGAGASVPPPGNEGGD